MELIRIRIRSLKKIRIRVSSTQIRRNTDPTLEKKPEPDWGEFRLDSIVKKIRIRIQTLEKQPGSDFPPEILFKYYYFAA